MTAKDLFVNSVISQLPPMLSADSVKAVLHLVLNDYDVSEKSFEIAVRNQNKEAEAIQMFFVTKKIEGLSDKTLSYYQGRINHFLKMCPKSLNDISASDVKYYLAWRGFKDNVSKCTQDNELRVLKSFFGWLSGEGYISSNPCVRINPIKQDKRIKAAFSEIDLERLRQACDNERDLALIDFFYSTGARVSEVAACNISDVHGEEVNIIGKGNKERIVFLNAKAILSLEKYLRTRSDESPALFVSLNNPHERLGKSGIETIFREIGKTAGVSNVHPHRFRRTCATLSLNRGMPIEQVSQMLGHEKIETTTIYARSSKENVKSSHKKYVT